ncbi:hypothetical protein ACO0LB_17805 [Undibacterium sp. SXout7W]|uniref:hypothetical protein n=1 Tax=Undibacterium sp. SXout7W TaxID=3413049 RepID=UPI003BEFDFD1
MLGYLIAFAAGFIVCGLFVFLRNIHRAIKREQIINTACATLYRHGIETADYFPYFRCVQGHDIGDALSLLTGTGHVAIFPNGEVSGELRIRRVPEPGEVHWLTLMVARRHVIES